MKNASIVVLFGIILSGCAQLPDAAESGLPGKSLSLSEAVSECTSAYIAELVSLGSPEPSPPGASDYQSQWKITGVLKATEPSGGRLGIRVQTHPEGIREVEPEAGNVYILLSYPHSMTQIRKIIANTPDNQQQVKAELKKQKESNNGIH